LYRDLLDDLLQSNDVMAVPTIESISQLESLTTQDLEVGLKVAAIE
jgi:hypothetical protein